MTRPVVTNTVIGALKKLQKGTILFVDDFLDFGNSESVKKALYSMEEKGLLILPCSWYLLIYKDR